MSANLRQSGRPGLERRVAPGVGVKILKFYVSSPMVIQGEKTSLCYGVANARTVRILPESENLNPVSSRCFEIAPAENKTYTLVAEGFDGSVASESVKVTVEPYPLPEPQVLHVAGSRQSAGRDSGFRAVRAPDTAGRLVAAVRRENIGAAR
jgi:hypothetical protein